MEITPPIRGIFKGSTSDKTLEMTSPYMNNVRPKDTLENKMRIGQRPGIKKWSATLIGGAQPIVAMCSVSSVV